MFNRPPSELVTQPSLTSSADRLHPAGASLAGSAGGGSAEARDHHQHAVSASAAEAEWWFDPSRLHASGDLKRMHAAQVFLLAEMARHVRHSFAPLDSLRARLALLR